jgi:hypothetical protein
MTFSGLKHIRGILYEEYPDQVIVPVRSNAASTSGSGTAGSSLQNRKKSSAEEDQFAMSCKECGRHNKTIKGLKMHIKLLHLKSGKFQCKK